MMNRRIGILHPGQMGVTVGAAARAAGAWVGWASEGRSEDSRGRADGAGLEDCGTLSALAEKSEMLISVCPPAAATELAGRVAAEGFSGIFVDANAISPETARQVCEIVEGGGASFVDGGLIGPPALKEGTTRLYLSGAGAPAVAEVFGGSILTAAAIGPTPGAASAMKMCYAAYTKGSTALLMAIRALAAAEGVDTALMQEWALSQQGLEARSERAVRNNAFKAWRFAGEMLEIGATFEAAGLPGGFHRAASDVYRRLAGYKDCDPAPEVADVVSTLLSAED
jgi:3-hydroxyisobutyrate dehydrogenase-like beta-hydroxyacid dehydrogenase